MIRKLSYIKYHFSKLVLAVGVLFSAFTFLDDIDNLPSQTDDTNQTEQLFSGNDGSKKITSFYNALAFSLAQEVLSHCIKEHKYTLLLSNKIYSRLHKVNLNRAQSYEIARRFISHIYYSHNSSKGKPFAILLG